MLFILLSLITISQQTPVKSLNICTYSVCSELSIVCCLVLIDYNVVHLHNAPICPLDLRCTGQLLSSFLIAYHQWYQLRAENTSSIMESSTFARMTH